jgi:hypothetical protein
MIEGTFTLIRLNTTRIDFSMGNSKKKAPKYPEEHALPPKDLSENSKMRAITSISFT